MFIESRDPYESKDCNESFDLINSLSEKGHDVALYLTQNGVFCARNESSVTGFNALLAAKSVTIYADDYSIEERGILSNETHSEIKVTSIDKMSDLLMEDDRKPIWH